MAINCVMVGGQVIIIFVGGKAFNVVHLNRAQWLYSVILGALSIPVGAAIRLIPDELIVSLIPDYLKRRPKGPEVTISDEEEHFRFPRPLADVKDARDQFLPRSRSGSRSRSNSIPQTPNAAPQREDSFGSQATHVAAPGSRKRGRSSRSRSNSALGATTVMAGIIAGSVAGWSPIERNYNTETESTRFARWNARTELESRDGVEVHPATKPDDQIITESPQNLDGPPSQIPEVTPAPTAQDNLSPPQSPPRAASRP
jgi:Ca2+-transporting ATPase